jgi:hypothetical protein
MSTRKSMRGHSVCAQHLPAVPEAICRARVLHDLFVYIPGRIKIMWQWDHAEGGETLLSTLTIPTTTRGGHLWFTIVWVHYAQHLCSQYVIIWIQWHITFTLTWSLHITTERINGVGGCTVWCLKLWAPLSRGSQSSWESQCSCM